MMAYWIDWSWLMCTGSLCSGLSGMIWMDGTGVEKDVWDSVDPGSRAVLVR
jgi:hypothetical protein